MLFGNQVIQFLRNIRIKMIVLHQPLRSL